eukprot:3533263-Alexandrium_andersonii.AAC.1
MADWLSLASPQTSRGRHKWSPISGECREAPTGLESHPRPGGQTSNHAWTGWGLECGLGRRVQQEITGWSVVWRSVEWGGPKETRKSTQS